MALLNEASVSRAAPSAASSRKAGAATAKGAKFYSTPHIIAINRAFSLMKNGALRWAPFFIYYQSLKKAPRNCCADLAVAA
jgi:hypothetical protein